MNGLPASAMVLAALLSLGASSVLGFDKHVDALNSARANMNQRRFAEALSDADAGLRLATNQADRVSAMMLRAQVLDRSGKAEESVAAYRAIVEDPQSDTRQRVAAYRSIADLTLRNASWAKTRDVAEEARACFDGALQLPDLTPADTLNLLADRAGTYETAEDWRTAITELGKILSRPDLTTDQRIQMLARTACARMEAGQGKVDADVDTILKLPVSAASTKALGGVAEKLARTDLSNAERILRRLLVRQELRDAQRSDLLQSILRLHLSRSDYDLCRPIMDEVRGQAEGKSIRIDATLIAFASKAADASDFKTAESCYRQVVAVAPDNVVACLGAAQMAMVRGDAATAQADLQKVTGNAKTPASQRYVARVLELAVARADADAFRQQIAKVDLEFAGENFTEEQRFKLLREASSRLFTGYRYDDVRALEAETAAMLRPEARKTFVCRYVKDPPRSADAWARSPLLKDTQYRESRFERYPKPDELPGEINRLKGTNSAEAAACKEGYETQVYAVYDERGVHIYVQCGDPEARKVERGLLGGGSLEMYLQPGRDHAYHWWYFELPRTDDPHQVNWDTPHRHYRYTYDYLIKDTVVGDVTIGAYTFIPWLLVYDKLPSESNGWAFSVLRGSRGGLVTLGGAVHELGRAVELSFEMPPERVTAVKREIVARAFAKYQGDKSRLDGVSLWSDPDLGDPEFDRVAIQPLLASLDKAGEKVTEKMSDADVEALFAQFVPDWMEFAFKTAELRQAYLEKELFGAGKP